MKILSVDPLQPQAEIVRIAANYVRQGKVLLHPTETCYGFAVDIFQKSALELLYRIKNMAWSKPTSMMVRDLEEAQKYAVFNPMALELAREFWPGPLTLVLPRRAALPDFFNEGHQTVGLRCPDSHLVRALIEAVGRPLSTTSANFSGQPEAYEVQTFLQQAATTTDLERQFLEENVLILDGGKLSAHPPSTLVGFQDGDFSILRRGAMIEQIETFLTFLEKSPRT